MTISANAINWLASGHRGCSSNTIFRELTDMDVGTNVGCHPLDPSDFRRCELLLRLCPEFRDDMWKMSAVSPVWANLVRSWGDVVRMFEEECPDFCRSPWLEAPKTYSFMKSLGC